MNDTKVPDSSNDWQNMDIFLFSNGQLNSPPRKYHLRSEELNWWDATLNFLARSQYGSMNTRIDLYTTGGHKLEGPLQLQNGAAYVAVEQQNIFIDSGYDKYLIKATRSLEKRQAKKPNSKEKLFSAENINKTAAEITKDANNEVQKDNAFVESTLLLPNTGRLRQMGNSSALIPKKKQSPVTRPTVFRKIGALNAIDTDILVKATESLEKRPAKRPNSNETLSSVEKTNDTVAETTMNATNNNVQKDNAVVESTAENSFHDQDKPLKPQAQHYTRRLSQKSNSSATKEIDKRKPSRASRPPVYRRTSALNPTDTSLAGRKASLKRSNSPPKRNLKVTGKTNEKSYLEGNLGSKPVTKSMTKTIHNKVLETILQPIVDPINIEKLVCKSIDSSQGMNTVITPNPKSQVTDANQVDNLLNDKDIIIVSDLYNNPITEITSAVVDPKGNTVKGESITQELIKINEESETSELICRGFAANESGEHKYVSKNPSKIKFTTAPTIQAYSESDKQDDSYLTIINRGEILNLQLKIEVRNADGSTCTAQKTREPLFTANLIKLDKSSQVRIDNDLLLHSKTLYSTFTSENAELINSDGTQIVVQCGCCEQYCNNIKDHNATELKDNKKYDMRLPTPKSSEGCKSDDDIPKEKPIVKTCYPDRSSNIHTIKKTYSDMSLERLEYLIDTQDMNVTEINSTNLNINEDNSRNDIITNRQVDKGEQAKSEFKTINKNPSESVADLKKTECSVMQTVPTFVDKSIQTEMCNLLLEARCLEDGRYTFHLPPLNVIKYYTM